MENYFIPYVGKRPASLFINGHKLVILSHERAVIEESLELIGADSVKVVKVKDDTAGQDKVFGKIARQVDGGIVIAPNGVELKDVIRNLESELPWLH